MEDPLFDAAGALRADYAAIDWAATPLGGSHEWTATLRLTVALMFETRFPTTLMWGPERVMVYNEPYAALIGEKHPSALGRPVAASFEEAWDAIGPLVETAFAGEAVYLQDLPLPLVRQGFLEECHFTFCYSPVRNRSGAVEGIIDIAYESTEQVVSRRRIDFLGRLSALLAGLDTAETVLAESVRLLRTGREDLAAVDLRGAVAPGAVVEPETRLPAEPRSPIGDRDLFLDLHDGQVLVWLPLRTAVGEPGDDVPLLVVETSPLLPLDEDYLVFLRLVAGNVAQALDRVESLATERRSAQAERELSEALQRSLLGAASVGPGLAVAVRYQAAEHLAQIGGDWYDAFVLDDGTTAVVVGDVAGHDQHAAVAMAQVKNLLRGTAYGVGREPASVLAAVDRALISLEVDALATVVLAYVEDAADGGHRLRWANAGHPPPVLLTTDGRARLLDCDGEPEVLLGVGAGADRASTTTDLPPGSTVVFFTDGLVERRVGDIEDGLRWITDTLTGHHDLDPEALCDLLLERALPGVEDDVALVALRVPPQS